MLLALWQNKELIIEVTMTRWAGGQLTDFFLKTHEHRLILHNLFPTAQSSGEGRMVKDRANLALLSLVVSPSEA